MSDSTTTTIILVVVIVALVLMMVVGGAVFTAVLCLRKKRTSEDECAQETKQKQNAKGRKPVRNSKHNWQLTRDSQAMKIEGVQTGRKAMGR